MPLLRGGDITPFREDVLDGLEPCLLIDANALHAPHAVWSPSRAFSSGTRSPCPRGTAHKPELANTK